MYICGPAAQGQREKGVGGPKRRNTPSQYINSKTVPGSKCNFGKLIPKSFSALSRAHISVVDCIMEREKECTDNISSGPRACEVKREDLGIIENRVAVASNLAMLGTGEVVLNNQPRHAGVGLLRMWACH